MINTAILFVCIVAAQFVHAEEQNITIGLIGDSTVAPTYGWGPAFSADVGDHVTVLNYAQNGATLLSLANRDDLYPTLDDLIEEQPDYIIIQFGHNDMKRYDPQVYGDKLTDYVDQITLGGIKAVIFSSVTRRIFDEEGNISPRVIDGRTLQDYAVAAQAVAQATEVPFVDLNSISIEHHNEIGPEASAAYNYIPTDTTHFSPLGAAAIADLIIEALAVAVPEMDLSVEPPPKGRSRVFLLGGQSNMVGQGANDELLPPYDGAQNDVMYWNDGWVPLSPGFGNTTNHFGPEVAFGRAIKNALPNDTLYLIKYGANGTALYDDWKPADGPQYTAFMNTVHAALSNLNTAGIEYEISGMLWMQGESDAYEGQAAGYETNLTNFITVMRTELNAPAMPFIMARVLNHFGGIVPPKVGEQTDPTQAYIVRTSQVTVAETTPYSTWFDTDAYQVVDPASNRGHYGTQGQIDLGNDFAAANLSFIPKVKIGVADSTMSLEWNSTTGATYTLSKCNDLAMDPPIWSLVVGGIPASPPENAIILPIPGEAAMFYTIAAP